MANTAVQSIISLIDDGIVYAVEALEDVYFVIANTPSEAREQVFLSGVQAAVIHEQAEFEEFDYLETNVPGVQRVVAID